MQEPLPARRKQEGKTTALLPGWAGLPRAGLGLAGRPQATPEVALGNFGVSKGVKTVSVLA